jgi:hypothetical protein
MNCFANCAASLGWGGWVALAAAVLPSLVVALTRYPRASGAVSAALAVLDRLSVLAHSDSPGTVKLPVIRSEPPGSRMAWPT